jgi:glycerol-3-phosphate cytidylyltransferase-like family protein
LAKNVAEIAVLGQIRDPYAVIRKYQPDIIALGYDQNSFTNRLKIIFPKIKIVRLKPFKKRIYKSSLINK